LKKVAIWFAKRIMSVDFMPLCSSVKQHDAFGARHRPQRHASLTGKIERLQGWRRQGRRQRDAAWLTG
jgi:hypothetical protein